MVIDFLYLSGIIGLIVIIVGVLLNNKKKRNFLFFIGGLFLVIYSVYIQDKIFIILEVVFTIAAAYKLK